MCCLYAVVLVLSIHDQEDTALNSNTDTRGGTASYITDYTCCVSTVHTPEKPKLESSMCPIASCMGGLRSEPPSPSSDFVRCSFLLRLSLVSVASLAPWELGGRDCWLILAGGFENQSCLNEWVMTTIIRHNQLLVYFIHLPIHTSLYDTNVCVSPLHVQI